MFESLILILCIIGLFFYWKYILYFFTILIFFLIIKNIYNNKKKKEQEIIKQKEETFQKKLIKKNVEENAIKRKEYIKKCQQEFSPIIQSMKEVSIQELDCKYKKKNLYDMPEYNFSTIRKNSSSKDISNFIVLDVETTGLHCKNDNIVELSAIKFIDKKPVEFMSTLINPGRKIPIEATIINNINNEMVKDSPSINNVIDSFSNFIKGFNIVGYNLEFDLKFLFINNLNLFSEKRKYYDLLPICRKHISKNYIDNYKLSTVCEYYNIFREDAHRSTSDCLATGLLFIDIADEIKEQVNF